MTHTIWKFPIEIVGEQEVQMPGVHYILHAAIQDGKLCLWAKVEAASPLHPVRIYIYGTGHTFPANRYHIGSVQHGAFVWHVFIDDIPF